MFRKLTAIATKVAGKACGKTVVGRAHGGLRVRRFGYVHHGHGTSREVLRPDEETWYLRESKRIRRSRGEYTAAYKDMTEFHRY
jgi:hypothetical protein